MENQILTKHEQRIEWVLAHFWPITTAIYVLLILAFTFAISKRLGMYTTATLLVIAFILRGWWHINHRSTPKVQFEVVDVPDEVLDENKSI